MVIEYEGAQWSVLKIQILQPGKGGAFIQVEMRNVATGNKSQTRWRTQDTVERLEVRELDCTFLYKDGDMYTFMDKDTFEQFSVVGDVIGQDRAVSFRTTWKSPSTSSKASRFPSTCRSRWS